MFITRQAELLHVPISNTNVLYKTTRHRRGKLWNYTAMDCNYAFVTFKCQLNSLLLLNNISAIANYIHQCNHGARIHENDIAVIYAISLLLLYFLCSLNGYSSQWEVHSINLNMYTILVVPSNCAQRSLIKISNSLMV